ncbi:MAG: hemerythrin family protein, partial [Eubacterium sp.]|nr:hemerythrin family protein [Eubacterium sp.]
RDEEDYMKKVGYPGLSQQKKAHSVFIDRLVKLDIGDMDFIDEHQQEYLEDLIIYLLDWLTHHILMEDKAIGKWVKKKGLTL